MIQVGSLAVSHGEIMLRDRCESCDGKSVVTKLCTWHFVSLVSGVGKTALVLKFVDDIVKTDKFTTLGRCFVLSLFCCVVVLHKICVFFCLFCFRH